MMLLGAVALMAAAAQAPSLSVADVLAKSDTLEKKGMLAIFSSDLGQIKAEANRDMDAFGGEMVSARKAHRPLPACPPEVQHGWKITYTTDEVLRYYRSIPPQRRGMSSVQAFAEFMKLKYPCR